MAHWLTVRNARGWLVFLDHALAGIAAGLVVLLYEDRRQRALETLRESEERFRLARRCCAGGDLDCEIPTNSATTSTRPGWTLRDDLWMRARQWLGRNHAFRGLAGVYEDLHPGFRSRAEKFNMEYRLRRHDGEYRWIFDVGCRDSMRIDLLPAISELELMSLNAKTRNRRWHRPIAR